MSDSNWLIKNKKQHERYESFCFHVKIVTLFVGLLHEMAMKYYEVFSCKVTQGGKVEER